MTTKQQALERQGVRSVRSVVRDPDVVRLMLALVVLALVLVLAPGEHPVAPS